jgi:hypothetical protein
MAENSLRIFISYSRVDTAFVDRLEAILRSKGFSVWVDRNDIEGGEDWLDAIEEAIDDCTVVVAVLSQEAVESHYVKSELQLALAKKKELIPLLYRPCKIPFYLGPIQLINVEGGKSTGVDHVVERLQRIAARSTTAIADPYQLSKQPAPTKPTNKELSDLYLAGYKARTAGNFEEAATYWRQVLEVDPNFNSVLISEMRELDKQLHDQHIQQLRDHAQEMRMREETEQLIGDLEALLRLVPSDADIKSELYALQIQKAFAARQRGVWKEEVAAWEAVIRINPYDRQAGEYLPIARQNEQCQTMYEQVRQFIAENDLMNARNRLQDVWKHAPYFGDPDHFASLLAIPVPQTYEQHKAAEAARQAEVARQAAEEERERVKARKLAEEERRQETARLASEREAQRKAGEEAQKREAARLVAEKEAQLKAAELAAYNRQLEIARFQTQQQEQMERNQAAREANRAKSETNIFLVEIAIIILFFYISNRITSSFNGFLILLGDILYFITIIAAVVVVSTFIRRKLRKN